MNSVRSTLLAAAAQEAKTASPLSEAKLAANKNNAQLSTGPTSPAGKGKSSLNGVKTALTGQTVLLPTDDAAAYEAHLRGYAKELKPVGRNESDLVQSIADSSWRMLRIPVLEAAIYAKGQIQFAAQFEDHDPALCASLIQLETHLFYEKQLRNLHIQESRLHRRREKDLAALRELQKERGRNERIALEAASRLYTQAKRTNQPFNLTELGFEFSMDDLQAYIEVDPVAQVARAAQKKAAHAATVTQSAA